MRFSSALVVVVAILVGSSAFASGDGLLCRMPALSSPAIDFSSQSAVEFVRRNVDTLVLLDGAEVGPVESEVVVKKAGPVRYSINESISAAVSYNHTRLFENATSRELRSYRFGAFSTDRERDIVGLGMDWSVGDSVLGLGYRLESTRPAPGQSTPASILPRSEAVEHAVTLGVTRRWGGSD